jgi:hypothetical protein
VKQENEKLKVTLADAIVQPNAVVVKLADASIATRTVHSLVLVGVLAARISVDRARVTKLERH